MLAFYLGLVLFLFLNILAGLLRISRGASMNNRMLALQLFGTTGVAILLLLAETMQIAALQDVALVFVLLAVLALVSYVKLVGPQRSIALDREDAL